MNTSNHRQQLKVWWLILLWVISICPIMLVSYYSFNFTPRIQMLVGGYFLNIDAALISILALFTWFWLPFVTIGIGFVLFPHKVIDNVLQMRQRMKEFLHISIPEDHIDPHGASQVFIVRSWGIIFAVITGLPLVVIFFTWQG
jgi:hypothetical protein